MPAASAFLRPKGPTAKQKQAADRKADRALSAMVLIARNQHGGFIDGDEAPGEAEVDLWTLGLLAAGLATGVALGVMLARSQRA